MAPFAQICSASFWVSLHLPPTNTYLCPYNSQFLSQAFLMGSFLAPFFLSHHEILDDCFFLLFFSLL